MTKGKFRPVIFSIIVLMHFMALYALWYAFTDFSWSHPGFSYNAWVWFFVFYTLRSIGVSLGSHRLFTHRAFKCHFTTEVALNLLAGTAAEGPLHKWVIDHKQHHWNTEGDWDPHTPAKYPGFYGFCWAHMLWLFYDIIRPDQFAENYGIKSTRIAKWDQFLHPIGVLSGFLIPWYFAGFEGLLLAGFVGVVFHWHITWCVNSVCHTFGSTDTSLRQTKDTSKNNWPLSIVSYLGEAWHNYHHQKADSAILGWKWYHPDLGKWILYCGEPLGLFWGIKRPPKVV